MEPITTLTIRGKQYPITAADAFMDNGACVQLILRGPRLGRSPHPELTQKAIRELRAFRQIAGAQAMERQPCPFCGSNETGITHIKKRIVVVCLNCSASGPTLEDETDNWRMNDCRVIMLWNHRGQWPSLPNA
jgi:hypothetical protein